MDEVDEDYDPYAWINEDDEPVHLWFSLSYANYLVLHRSLMQSMPAEWQRRMVRCLFELDDAFRHVDKPDSFLVQARNDSSGKFVKDPIPPYNRGRTFIQPIFRESAVAEGAQ